ncbi:bifunctional 23S rRNA (guanine(2069)-N(7))-methyltransferase RlmK/23S rRNA (guanine(2445)-N(2))-methyltransferase RlmL [Alteromonas sp. ASW11-36]|uniref:Ribosomal RNA large subunit methyltransferase K/L n=1 Tax=Alteromonas arenosi TaxID=3055817 RepID=A0ABT7SXF8_9ALTE|nr:bifunctional 23S rRNA (guanine(2069)-N(7))-methyltransferase RlmK/23S rRNA (guanine(2445)-N(2))-methyltransferase RlmL [Alteromonas sp. ASW11-36]MDM7860872.1 bifunctional 23S rRNA (guanine(2069)-N(7))-methyltransferase RlmK/23S rRNA (guanine(2445)-N(2))-methyltransferase RlmL [Alteromonas sp. ASW11-36]
MLILTTSRGLDELLRDEVTRICPNLQPRLKPGQVIVEAELADAYRLCLWSRLANRVIWVLTQGPADNAQQLYDTVSSIEWQQHFDAKQTFMINFSGTNRALKNSQFAAQRVKDGIVDHFIGLGNARPDVDKLNPDVIIQARLWRDTVTLGIDLSGGSLHQRGYRSETGEAPLKEHVASAILYRSGWLEAQSKPMLDPMCGSGTIAIEAALISTNRAPGLTRKRWGFTQWQQHNQRLWESILSHAKDSICDPKGPIVANDNQSSLIAIAKKNADAAGVFNAIKFQRQDALSLVPEGLDEGFMVSNPPYGERLSDMATLVPFFNQWGIALKQNFANWRISLLSSQRDLLRQLKLRAKNEYALMNGNLECKLANYVMDTANLEVRDSSTTSEFANRLKKNIKQLQRFLKKANTNAYRIYDADLPDYNVAIDVYADWLVVQEYAPPKNIPAEKARRRLNDIIIQLPSITGFDPQKIAVKVRSQQKGSAQYQKVAEQSSRIVVEESGAKFYINPTDYLDCGLFLDHRVTRQMFAEQAQQKHVLNLFAYTGSVSVHCALRGARSITTVDLSKTYLDWAKDNFKLNGLTGAYSFIQADCVKWLADNNKQFDLMFIDPPSFSNSKRMEGTWDVQRDHVALLADAVRNLTENGVIYFSNNLRSFKLDQVAVEALGLSVENISGETLPEDFKRNPKIHQCWRLTKCS